jgi:hypothetical protein
MIREGVFDQIHKIRTANVTRVSEALDVVDQGGFWKRLAAPRDKAEQDGN